MTTTAAAILAAALAATLCLMRFSACEQHDGGTIRPHAFATIAMVAIGLLCGLTTH